MPDDPKPRFKPEDLLPRDFEKQLESTFEKSFSDQGEELISRKRCEELFRSLIGMVTSQTQVLAFRAAAVALENYAEALEQAVITTNSVEARVGMEEAVKTAVESARSQAKLYNSMADKAGSDSADSQ